MEIKKPEQLALNFEDSKPIVSNGRREYHHPLCLRDSFERVTVSEGAVYSFARKVAEKEQENDRKLFEGILSRVKHLQF